MAIYDLIYGEINNRYKNGELTLEQANKVNDLAYDKYIVEKIETNILDKKFINHKYTLYHATYKDLKTIKPNSLNIGTRLSKMRTSSFWSKDKSISILFAVMNFLSYYGIIYKLNLDDKKCYVLDKEIALKSNPKDYHRIPYFAEKFYNSNEQAPIYLYEINNIPIKDVGRGQYSISEYTLDKEISPSKKDKLSFSDINKYISYVNEDEFIKIKSNSYGERKTLGEKLIFKDPKKVMEKRIDEYNLAKKENRFDPETTTIVLKKNIKKEN